MHKKMKFYGKDLSSKCNQIRKKTLLLVMKSVEILKNEEVLNDKINFLGSVKDELGNSLEQQNRHVSPKQKGIKYK